MRGPGTSGGRPPSGPSGTGANHFPTPSVGAGLLLAPAGNRVVAFQIGHSGPSSAASPGPSGHTPSGPAPSVHTTPLVQGGGVAPAGGLSGGAVAGIVVASLVVLAGHRLAGVAPRAEPAVGGSPAARRRHRP